MARLRAYNVSTHLYQGLRHPSFSLLKESIVAIIPLLVILSTCEHQTSICIYSKLETFCQDILLPNFLCVMAMDMLVIGKSLRLFYIPRGIPESYSTCKVRCVCKQKAVSLP